MTKCIFSNPAHNIGFSAMLTEEYILIASTTINCSPG